MDLASSIRYYREKANMYQSDLGKALGVSAQAVSKWELGKSEPDRDCILKMCALFNISADELLGREAVVSQEPWDADAAFNDMMKEDKFSILARGLSKMSPEKRDNLLSGFLLMFKDDFDEKGNKK